jgi:hypothetical protein
MRPVRDLDKALADISTIRSQIAAGTAFRGYGPAALAATGILALVTALALTLWLEDATGQPIPFLFAWAAAAVVAIALMWIEMRRRAHRHHSGLADAMIHQAMEQFLPAAAAGALLPLLLMRFAPETLWMIPGLWQLLMWLGIFASVRSLPRTIALVGAWYFVAGLAVLMIASDGHTLSPWTMGIPFAVGQFLMAALLYLSGKRDAES